MMVQPKTNAVVDKIFDVMVEKKNSGRDENQYIYLNNFKRTLTSSGFQLTNKGISKFLIDIHKKCERYIKIDTHNGLVKKACLKKPVNAEQLKKLYYGATKPFQPDMTCYYNFKKIVDAVGLFPVCAKMRFHCSPDGKVLDFRQFARASRKQSQNAIVEVLKNLYSSKFQLTKFNSREFIFHCKENRLPLDNNQSRLGIVINKAMTMLSYCFPNMVSINPDKIYVINWAKLNTAKEFFPKPAALFDKMVDNRIKLTYLAYLDDFNYVCQQEIFNIQNELGRLNDNQNQLGEYQQDKIKEAIPTIARIYLELMGKSRRFYLICGSSCRKLNDGRIWWKGIIVDDHGVVKKGDENVNQPQITDAKSEIQQIVSELTGNSTNQEKAKNENREIDFSGSNSKNMHVSEKQQVNSENAKHAEDKYFSDMAADVACLINSNPEDTIDTIFETYNKYKHKSDFALKWRSLSLRLKQISEIMKTIETG